MRLLRESEDFEKLVATNLFGFFFLTQQTLRQMRKQQFGHIVTISATIADQLIASAPAVAQILTKGGLNAATRALAIEYAREGIWVNAIALVATSLLCYAQQRTGKGMCISG